ncbi:MAG: class I SAM-dependent methyltransferase [Alphaproteobacteria bacterium]|nr:class I SAM-dependent methyltransferase [Alphaproteobacteria bacterium]
MSIPSKMARPAPESDAKAAMDRMYRWTRHVYDASRKYYLLGRDVLIRHIRPAAGEVVCEVGCGTARNLRKMAPRYTEARFCGIDASDEMLKSARNILKNRGLSEKVQVEQGFAQSFDPAALFGLTKPLDKIVFSYALSIIPPWRESVDHALTLLKSGGEIHIVDFGAQAGLPAPFRAFVFWWLKQFHVYHKPEILNYLRRLELEKKGTLKVIPLYKGYADYAVFKKN